MNAALLLNSFRNSASLRTLTGAVALASFGLTSAGCTVAAAPGSIVADWTIAGGKDAASCTATGTASVRVDVIDGAGRKLNSGSDTQDCNAFATSIAQDFGPGSYTVQVTMLAADSTPRTTTATQAVVVNSGITTTALVDFPLSSFH